MSMGNEEQKMIQKKYSIFFFFFSHTVNSDFFFNVKKKLRKTLNGNFNGNLRLIVKQT